MEATPVPTAVKVSMPLWYSIKYYLGTQSRVKEKIAAVRRFVLFCFVLDSLQ